MKSNSYALMLLLLYGVLVFTSALSYADSGADTSASIANAAVAREIPSAGKPSSAPPSRNASTFKSADLSAYILTPKAPVTPRINGPKVYGNRPGTPFLFKIPASGNRPMTFSAKGLPAGLKLDSSSGIITGTVRRSGTWNVTLTAVNEHGACSRNLKIVIGDRICLTPPMGWNSWNCWRMSVSQEKVRSSVDALLEKGLDRYGWSYVNVDDGWQLERGGRYGAIQPNDKFPDMKGLVDYVHSKGLKFGIYSSPWAMCPGGTIGSSATNPEGRAWWIDEGKAGEYNIYTRPESDKHKYKNAWEGPRFHGDYLFMDADVCQWGEWGVDLLKYDWHPNDYFSIKQMHDALAVTGRSIAFSLSNRAPIGLGDVYVNMANAWRTSSDIHDLWYDIHRIGFTMMDRWAAYTGPGHWPDADMLEIGAVADPARGEGYTRTCRLTPAEQYTHFTLWAILCSPLLIGCDLAQIDDFTLSLLTNSEVIDVNQDALGYPAARVAQDDSTVVYHKPLEDGSLVVAMFNISSRPRRMGFRVGELNYMMVESQTVRDLWRQKDIAVLHPGERFEGDFFETEVEPHGCRLLKLSPGLNYAQGKWWSGDGAAGGNWTAAERKLVCESPRVMRVLTVDNPEDLTVLRDSCCDLSGAAIRSSVYKMLEDKMIATVTDSTMDGVGIAGPQVGIRRRVVAVQRFDKAGEPFELYPNIRVTAMRGQPQPGREGCLSVPERYGTVLRSRDIDIRYTSLATLRDTMETVTGFTAVIFQHECDHLDGVIFTDRIGPDPGGRSEGDQTLDGSKSE